MLSEFKARRGYDPTLWLPVLTGVIVGSPEQSDRFLWDFRRTIAELFAENHYGEISTELHNRGMGYYGEALEFHRPSLGDDMEMRRHDDIPMGAMWTFKPTQGPAPSYVADLRGAASGSSYLRTESCRCRIDDCDGTCLGLEPGNAQAGCRP